MVIHKLEETIQQLTVSGKGILAADESQATIGKRFASLQIESTPESRRAYRELLFTTSGIQAFINGVILHEETLSQTNKEATLFPKYLQERGIVPGIKVDKGLIPLNDKEKSTQGLDDLTERLINYQKRDVRFAKWRAVFSISDTLPSSLAITTNAQALAQYAAICQENNLVPIVEPELLMEGDHSLARCAQATETTLRTIFQTLSQHRVLLEYIILKPSMVITGTDYKSQANITTVAETTLKTLQSTVPATVPSINFLSGGQSPELATAHLNAMNQLKQKHPDLNPWLLSFSYGRALQEPALKIWRGKADNVKTAQQAFYKRAKLNAAACKGSYEASMEDDKEAESVTNSH